MAPQALGAKRAAARAAVTRICSSGLPALDLLDQVAGRVRQEVPHVGACWDLTDPATLLPTASVTTDLPAQLYLDVLDHELLEEDFATIRHLARRSRPAITLLVATGGAPERSSRYRRYGRPMGMGDELRTVFRTGHACWGNACMIRHESQPPFSQPEVAFMHGLCDPIAHGLRMAHLLDTATDHGADDAPGMVVLADDNSIESITAVANYWLKQLPVDRGSAMELPIVVYGVAHKARIAADGSGFVSPARARVQLPSGTWLLVHAARLRSIDGISRHTAVIVEPAKPGQVASVLLELHELTTREREIAQMLVRGLATDEISRQLFISRHTVRDHLKSIFDKLGVTSRPELTAMLFYEHVLPGMDRSDWPRRSNSVD